MACCHSAQQNVLVQKKIARCVSDTVCCHSAHQNVLEHKTKKEKSWRLPPGRNDNYSQAGSDGSRSSLGQPVDNQEQADRSGGAGSRE
jgi:cobalamin biosynthesis Mg chelatase CobN